MIQPNLLRLWRIFRIGSALRQFKFAKGLRKIVYTIMISIPATFNIGILLLLITFIYAVVGMNLFMNVKLINGMTETESFQTFGRSMTVLFRVCTGGAWDELLLGLSIANGDPGVVCTEGFDVQAQSYTFDTKYVTGDLLPFKL
jgi:hypothetical protein